MDGPDEKDINKLPRYAKAAFAARCAHRVSILAMQPRLMGLVAPILDAIRLAARVAANPTSLDETQAETAGQASEEAGNYASDLCTRCKKDDLKELLAATYAAYSASSCVDSLVKPESANNAVSNAYCAGEHGDIPEVPAEISRDFQSIRNAAKGGGDDDGFSQDLFGELWPNGPPSGWGKSASTVE